MFRTIFKRTIKGYILTPSFFLDGNEFVEKPDKQKLAFICLNAVEIKKTLERSGRDEVCLFEYCSKWDDAKEGIPVEYFQSDLVLMGRQQARGSLSGQGMLREFRHTIFSKDYVDVDMVNAHPVLLVWLCSNLGMDYSVFSPVVEYVDNREEHLADLRRLNPKMSREEAKRVFLAILFGNRTMIHEMKPSAFLRRYYSSVDTIMSSLESNFPVFFDTVMLRRISSGRDYNVRGSATSHLLQYLENQLLMFAWSKLLSTVDADAKLELMSSVLCFDGLMIPRTCWQSGFAAMLTSALAEMGVPVEFKEKAMDECVDLRRFKFREGFDYFSVLAESKGSVVSGIVPYVQNFFPETSEDPYTFDDFLHGLYRETPFKSLRDVLRYVSLNFGRAAIFVKRKMFIVKQAGDHLHEIDSITNAKLNSDRAPYFDGGVVKFVSLQNIYENHRRVLPVMRNISYDYDAARTQATTFYMWRPSVASELLAISPAGQSLLDEFLDFLKYNFCESNDLVFEYFIKWLAHLVKFRGSKSGVAVFLTGAQGCGKGTLTSFLSQFVLGFHMSRELQGLNALLADNNISFVSSRLLVVNEMSGSKDNFRSMFDKLKAYITDRDVTVKKLYCDSFAGKQDWEFIMCSNHTNAIHVERGDRRYFCLKTSDRHARDGKFFTEFRKKFFSRDFGCVFYTYLLSQLASADEFQQMSLPMTETKQALLEVSLGSVEAFVAWLATENMDFVNAQQQQAGEGSLFYSDEFIAPETVRGELRFKSSELYECFGKWCDRNGQRRVSAPVFKLRTVEYGLVFRRLKSGQFFCLV